MEQLKETIDKLATAFEEYKRVNDQKIEAIKSGQGTADLEAKLAKIGQDIDEAKDARARIERMEAKLARPGAFGGEPGQSKESAEYKNAFVNWVRNPADPERRMALQQRSAALSGVETKAVQTVTNNGAAGGFALPEEIERRIASLTQDISPIRRIATVRQVGTTDYKELFDVGGAGFEWVGETVTRNRTNTPDLAEVRPSIGTINAFPRASEESLDDLFFNVEDWLVATAADRLAFAEGQAFITGNGTTRPTGFLAGPAPVATADATRPFGTLQFLPSGLAAALPANFDVLVNMVYSLRARYRSNARWVTSRLVLNAMRNIKDSTGQYLWQPSLSANQPETLMGYPITEAEDMPAVAANAFPLAFGDFKEGYLIVDRVGMRMTRDDITAPGFVSFYVRRRVGGCLRNTQAIKLLRISV